MLPVVVCGILSTSSAYASDAYMYGGGVEVGSNLFPGQFPVTLPATVSNDGLIDKVGADLLLGGRGMYYVNNQIRIGGSADLDFGSGFSSIQALLQGDKVIREQGLDFFLGAGLGIGSMKFSNDAKNASFKVPYYPVAGNAGITFLDHTRAYEGMIFGQLDIPGSQTYTVNGKSEDLGGFFDATGIYFTIGIKADVMFGDFTKPKNKNKNKNKNNKKKGK